MWNWNTGDLDSQLGSFLFIPTYKSLELYLPCLSNGKLGIGVMSVPFIPGLYTYMC